LLYVFLHLQVHILKAVPITNMAYLLYTTCKDLYKYDLYEDTIKAKSCAILQKRPIKPYRDIPWPSYTVHSAVKC